VLTPSSRSTLKSNKQEEKEKKKRDPTVWLGSVPLPCLPAIAQINDQHGHNTHRISLTPD
jgi:hypothetical protein